MVKGYIQCVETEMLFLTMIWYSLVFLQQKVSNEREEETQERTQGCCDCKQECSR